MPLASVNALTLMSSDVFAVIVMRRVTAYRAVGNQSLNVNPGETPQRTGFRRTTSDLSR